MNIVPPTRRPVVWQPEAELLQWAHLVEGWTRVSVARWVVAWRSYSLSDTWPLSKSCHFSEPIKTLSSHSSAAVSSDVVYCWYCVPVLTGLYVSDVATVVPCHGAGSVSQRSVWSTTRRQLQYHTATLARLRRRHDCFRTFCDSS